MEGEWGEEIQSSLIPSFVSHALMATPIVALNVPPDSPELLAAFRAAWGRIDSFEVLLPPPALVSPSRELPSPPGSIRFGPCLDFYIPSQERQTLKVDEQLGDLRSVVTRRALAAQPQPQSASSPSSPSSAASSSASPPSLPSSPATPEPDPSRRIVPPLYGGAVPSAGPFPFDLAFAQRLLRAAHTGHALHYRYAELLLQAVLPVLKADDALQHVVRHSLRLGEGGEG